ncbi:hypothetical protein D7I43_31705 [Micromonospora globbae]|uniref:Uncharacterized protein n=1 Tax=Micromonospora globbae TaxID=1894969 RepID=A0A420EK37_9ACTN|nr:hypothetical protein D7I43_31705 [Micromonospora globbae]
MLRIARIHESVTEITAKSLGAIPVSELRTATVLRFTPSDMAMFKGVLESWQTKLPDGETRRAIGGLLGGQIV